MCLSDIRFWIRSAHSDVIARVAMEQVHARIHFHQHRKEGIPSFTGLLQPE